MCSRFVYAYKQQLFQCYLEFQNKRMIKLKTRILCEAQ